MRANTYAATVRAVTRLGLLAALLLLPASCADGGGGGGGGRGKGPGAFRVLDVVPTPSLTNVSVATPVAITFSRAVQPASARNGVTFQFFETAQPSVFFGGTLTLDPTGEVLVFQPVLPLLQDVEYGFRVTAGILDTSGGALDLGSSAVSFPSTFRTQSGADSTPPVFGGAQSATAVSDSAIDVTWLPATDDIDTPVQLVYDIYAATSPGGQSFATPTLTTAPGATSDTITGLSASTAYFFVVRARDSSGNADANTVEVSATTMGAPDVVPPSFGGAGAVAGLSTSSLLVSWNPASDNQAAPGDIVYNLYVASSPGGQNLAVPTATTAPGTLSHTLTGLVRDTAYWVVVRAKDPAGNEDTNSVEAAGRTFVSYGGQVQPIFTNTCATSMCHTGAGASQGLNLSNYNQTNNTGIDVPANQAALDRIEPFDSAASYLVHKIDGTQGSVGGIGNRMPTGPGAQPLSQAESDVIRRWVDQGAANN